MGTTGRCGEAVLRKGKEMLIEEMRKDKDHFHTHLLQILTMPPLEEEEEEVEQGEEKEDESKEKKRKKEEEKKRKKIRREGRYEDLAVIDSPLSEME